MSTSRVSSRPAFALAEDGEAIGTVHHFASHLDLPAHRVLPCLREHAEQSILLRAEGASEQLLILDAKGVEALRGCAGRSAE